MIEYQRDRKHVSTDVTGISESPFIGCVPPDSMPSPGEEGGRCARCGYYSGSLDGQGFCPACVKHYEKTIRKPPGKQYIKAGSRSQVDL